MTRPTLRQALAGLQAGVPGAIVMVLWVMAVSLFNRHSIWRVPNLFGTTFYGPEAYRGGFSMASASGLALILVIYGCLGAIWGIGFGEQRRAFLLVIGALTGLAVYFVFFRLIWTTSILHSPCTPQPVRCRSVTSCGG